MVKRQTIKILAANLVVVAGIAASLFCAFIPAFATETIIAPLKITEIYPNALNSVTPSGSETGFEFIEIANLSSSEVDLSQYGFRSKGKTKSLNLTGTIAPNSYLAIVSTSSFALVNSGETIQLVKVPSLEIIEEVTYGNTTTKEKSWSYFVEGWELGPITKGALNQKLETVPPPTVDVCPATPEIDSVLPAGFIINSEGACVALSQSPDEACLVEVSEISSQPNYNGQEYVEVSNNTNTASHLKLCKLKINEGAEKILPDVQLLPQERYVVNFASGAIRNSAGTITLIQSTNHELLYPYTASVSGQVINFEPGSLSGVISDISTPGSTNVQAQLSEEELAGMGAGVALAECGEGKYRNPETNRCKNSELTSTNLTSCGADQERNPATNRCRKISTATASLAPCSLDQERNPETNRCRKIGTTDDGLKPCVEGQERNPETNRCRKIATVVSGSALESAAKTASIDPFRFKTQIIAVLIAVLVGYGVYEYRTDIANLVEKIKSRKFQGRPPD